MSEMNSTVGRLGYRVSRNVLSTITPPIPTAYQWAANYKHTPQRPLLDMSQGVPGIPAPPIVQEALGKAASSPHSFGYTRWDGEPALRTALVHEMKVVYGKDADVCEEDVALTAGCNLAFVAAIMCVAERGDEVILPIPWYFNHQMTLELLGITPVPLLTHAADGFTPSVKNCVELITPRTKAIVLVTPNNPTGAIYPPTLLSSFHSLAKEHNIPLIIDETYRDFLDPSHGPPHTLFLPQDTSWRTNIIHLFSFSKAYALPGHRLGALIASPTLLQETKKVLDTIQICAPRPIQLALSPLLPSLREFVNDTAKAIRSRHVLFKQQLPKHWEIGAQGGYFAFVRHPFRRVHARDVCRRLASEMGVVTLPSEFFRFVDKDGVKAREEGESTVKQEDIQRKVDIEERWRQNDVPVKEEDRWIRFSVANVDDDRVRRVCGRLEECEEVFGWEVEDDA